MQLFDFTCEQPFSKIWVLAAGLLKVAASWPIKVKLAQHMPQLIGLFLGLAKLLACLARDDGRMAGEAALGLMLHLPFKR